MDVSKIKLIAFDLDGTITQHKTPVSAEHRAVMERLSKKYQLVMLGAGMCRRIFEQLGGGFLLISTAATAYSWRCTARSLEILRL